MSASLQFGAFQLDLSRRRLIAAGGTVAVGSRAFDLLAILAQSRGRVVDKNELLRRVWPGRVVEEANLAVQVNQLRRILGREAIATIPGVGYQLVLAEDHAARSPAADNPRPGAHWPHATTPLVGRQGDVRRVRSALQAHPLVTLIGPGGVGKTRLAMALMQEMSEGLADGAIWVDLTPAGATAVESTIATAARVALGDGPLAASLISSLARLNALLVLDNAETALDALRPLLVQLPRAAPGIQVLATSQLPLGCAHEQLVPLHGLALPPPDADWPRGRQEAAVQLLLDVVSRADPEYRWSDHDSCTVARLLGHLNGLPLAIEIVGCRIPQFGLDAFSDHWGGRWAKLPNRDAAAPARQSSMQAAFDWSCSLLSGGERTALRWLAACAGTFTLDLAEQLLRDIGPDPLQLLAGLCDASLVHTEPGHPSRFRMPDMVRWLARQAMSDAGEADAVRICLDSLLAATAHKAESEFWWLPDRHWQASYEHLCTDWEQAFEHACAHGQADTAAGVGEALLHADYLGGRSFVRSRQRSLRAFALIPAATPAVAARLWNVAAAWTMAPLPGLLHLAAVQARLQAWTTAAHTPQIAAALARLAVDARQLGESALAESAIASLRKIDRAALQPRLSVFVDRVCADGAAPDPDHAREMARLREVADQASRGGFDLAAGMALNTLVDLKIRAGDLVEAQRLGQSTAETLRQAGQPYVLGLVLSNLAAAQLLDHDDLGAARSLAEALPLLRRADLHHSIGDHLALLAARRGDHETAGRLLGISDAWYAAGPGLREPAEAELASFAEQLITAALGKAACAALRTQGATLAEVEALAIAQATLSIA